MEHKNATFSKDGNKVVYRSKRIFHFDKERSCKSCSLSDNVSLPNIPLQAVWRKIKDNVFKIIAINSTVNKNNITSFYNVNVGKLLFEGYEDPLLTALKKEYPSEFKNRTTNVQLFPDVCSKVA